MPGDVEKQQLILKFLIYKTLCEWNGGCLEITLLHFHSAARAAEVALGAVHVYVVWTGVSGW